MQVYLDNSATTKVSKEVAISIMNAMTETYGNPSSLHVFGQDAERLLKKARQSVADTIGAKPDNIIFTSGGTESDNLAFNILGRMSTRQQPDRTILVSAIEHPAVREPAEYFKTLGYNLNTIPVSKVGRAGKSSAITKDNKLSTEANSAPNTISTQDVNSAPGIIDIDILKEELDEKTAFVSVMHVNNEIGTIQPIGEIGKLIRERNNKYDSDAFFHCDAVQSFSKIPINIHSYEFENVDFISVSGHKIHGPKGIGALFTNAPARLLPMIYGGGQESGKRSGTENVPGTVGIGEAARTEGDMMLENATYVSNLRKILLDGIESHIDDIIINSNREDSISGEPGKCSPYILSVCFQGTRSEVILHSLENEGIYVSTGSACSSIGKTSGKSSDTLAAIGLSSKEAEGTLRFSLSRTNTEKEIHYVLEKLTEAVARYRKIGSFR